MPTISPPVSDPLTAWGIALMAVVVAVAWAWIWAHGRPSLRWRLLAAVCLVMAASAWAASSGLLLRFDLLPPPMAVMIVSVLVMAVAAGTSPLGRSVAESVPLVSLLALQSFRLPLELLMHRGATLGIVPVELSYSGYNCDILTGLGALALAAAMRGGAHVPRWAIWSWNLFGMWCLLVITAIAVASSPVLRVFGDDPRHVNTWVLSMPYVWVPVVLVACAIATHVVVTRALLMEASAAWRRGRPAVASHVP